MSSEQRVNAIPLNLVIAMLVLSIAIAFFIGACAPTQVNTPAESSNSSSTTTVSDTDSAEDDEPSITFSWSADSDCSLCHATESASITDSKSQLHLSHENLTCTQCHTDLAGLQSAHEKVSPDDIEGAAKLKTTQVTKETCLSCHEDDYTPEATAGITALTDTNGTTVNPHDLPVNDDHDAIACSSCHVMHTTNSITSCATKACLDCHHMGVYECGTCH